jgi:hypothetical protein
MSNMSNMSDMSDMGDMRVRMKMNMIMREH